MPQTLFACLSPGHNVIVLLIGVLLFGRRLPEVSRAVGKYILQFKEGIYGLEEDVWSGMSMRSDPQSVPHEWEEDSLLSPSEPPIPHAPEPAEKAGETLIESEPAHG